MNADAGDLRVHLFEVVEVGRRCQNPDWNRLVEFFAVFGHCRSKECCLAGLIAHIGAVLVVVKNEC